MSRLRTTTLIPILVPIVLLAAQWPATVLKLNALECRRIQPVLESQTCTGSGCRAVYSLGEVHGYLLLGHVIKSHRLYSNTSKEEIRPATQIRTILDETWPQLFVYDVKVASALKAEVDYPITASAKGFVGILPRECGSQNVASVPSIAPTLDFVAHITLAMLIMLVLGASRFPSMGRLKGNYLRDKTSFLWLSSTAFFLSLVLGTHLFDSLRLESGSVTNGLRFLAISTAFIPIAGTICRNTPQSIMIGMFASTCALFALASPANYVVINAVVYLLAGLVQLYS